MIWQKLTFESQLEIGKEINAFLTKLVQLNISKPSLVIMWTSNKHELQNIMIRRQEIQCYSEWKTKLHPISTTINTVDIQAYWHPLTQTIHTKSVMTYHTNIRH